MGWGVFWDYTTSGRELLDPSCSHSSFWGAERLRNFTFRIDRDMRPPGLSLPSFEQFPSPQPSVSGQHISAECTVTCMRCQPTSRYLDKRGSRPEICSSSATVFPDSSSEPACRPPGPDQDARSAQTTDPNVSFVHPGQLQKRSAPAQ